MLVIGGLASTILVDRIAFWAVPLVAFVGGQRRALVLSRASRRLLWASLLVEGGG